MSATRLQRHSCVRRPLPYQEEDFLVTFQCVLGASNGWVLASDTLANNFATGGRRGDADDIVVRESFHTSKISHEADIQTIRTVCGDDYARHLAGVIVESVRREPLDLSDFSSVEERLKRVTEEQWRRDARKYGKPNDQINRVGIFIFEYGRPFWIVDMGRETRVDNIYDRFVSGDRTNSAKFFSQHYYDPKRPVEELIPLAAHTVLMAGARNQSGVAGAEIVLGRWQAYPMEAGRAGD